MANGSDAALSGRWQGFVIGVGTPTQRPRLFTQRAARKQTWQKLQKNTLDYPLTIPNNKALSTTNQSRPMIAPQEHEYTVMGGANRAKVGRILSLAASGVSAGLVFLFLSAIDLAKKFGLNVNVPPTLLSLLGAGAVFGLLYLIFNNWAWKWPGVGLALKVPNIAGTWDCIGKTLNGDRSTKYDWQGEVTIVQSWDKLRIRLVTKESGSSSISAALAHDSIDGFVLLYHYRNDPKADAVGLAAHSGCSVMTISTDFQSASGEYFNGRGRMNFGTMTWKKRK